MQQALPELRMLIYEEVLGGLPLHIFVKSRKQASVRCKVPSKGVGAIRNDCWRTDSEGHTGGYPVDRENVTLLSLLLICCFIYSEAIEILYTLNIFSFRSLNTLFYMSQTVLQRRFHAIQFLTLSWAIEEHLYGPPEWSGNPPNDTPTWERTWRIISGMPNLHHVHVVLRSNISGIAQSEATILEPLKRVTLRGQILVGDLMASERP